MKHIRKNLIVYILTILEFVITFFTDRYINFNIENYVIYKIGLFFILLIMWYLILYLKRNKLLHHLIIWLIPIIIVLLVTKSIGISGVVGTLSMMIIPCNSIVIITQLFILALLINSILHSLKDYKYKLLFTIISITLITVIYINNLITKQFLFGSYYIVIIYYIIYILTKKNNRVVFISSTGGHLEELLQLRPTMEKYDYFIITEKTKTNEKLKDKFENKVGYLVYGTRKNLIKYAFVMFINMVKSFIYYLRIKPNVIVTTGTHTAVMMCYIGKLFGSKIIFIETYANRETKTLAGRLVYPISDLFIVQWKEMLKIYPKAEYFGGVY